MESIKIDTAGSKPVGGEGSSACMNTGLFPAETQGTQTPVREAGARAGYDRELADVVLRASMRWARPRAS